MDQNQQNITNQQITKKFGMAILVGIFEIRQKQTKSGLESGGVGTRRCESTYALIQDDVGWNPKFMIFSHLEGGKRANQEKNTR